MKFHNPSSLKECLYLLEQYSSKWLLAGGTDINIQMRQKRSIPENIIHINHLKELHEFKYDDKYLSIGALNTITDICCSEDVIASHPFIAEALYDFASPLIANLASIGGNIANASPTADTVPILLVLNAELELLSVNGSRIVALKDFYTGYKKYLMNPDELIANIKIPLGNKYFSRYAKIGSRKALTIAKASIAFLKINSEYRIATGSLTPFPRRLSNLEECLNKNSDVSDKDLLEALKADVTPITDFRSDANYRLQVTFNNLKEFYHQSRSEDL